MCIQKYSFLLAGVCFLVFPIAAKADDALTKDSIKAFYAQSIEVQLAGKEETLAFYNKHMSEDVTAILNLVNRVSGAPVEKSRFEYNKAELLSETEKGFDLARIKDMEGSVISSVIAPDGKTAKVKNSFVSKGVVRIPTPNGMVSARMEQSALCDDDLMLSGDGIIVYTKSICNAESLIELPKN